MFLNKPFIVAEMSSNHLGNLETAKRLVVEAKAAGADAIKLQTYTPEQMVGDPNYIIDSGKWKGNTLLELYELNQTPREWHKELFDLARSIGIVPFSTPFHPDDVEFLETLDCPIYKISSFEIGYTDLIKAAAKTGKPLIISLGVATRKEALEALISAQGFGRVVTLTCVSDYPANPEEYSLKDAGCAGPWGVSDHTIGNVVAVTATARGASVIEKHFTLDRSLGGADAEFSMEPSEFARMVKDCRLARKIAYTSSPVRSSYAGMKRGLWFAEDLKKGTIIEPRHIKIARPAGRTPPSKIDEIIGTTLDHDVKAGTWV